MISHKHKAVFVHINKTGGMSIETALGIAFGHDTAVELRKKLTPEQWKSYFKFAFVRNPWDRMVSMFYYRKGVKWNIDPNISFPDWIKKNDTPNRHIAFGPQLDWISQNDLILVDFIGRFENIKEDFDHVREVLKINKNLPHINKTKHGHYTQYYNDTTKEIVGRWHKKDIDCFNYTFDNKDIYLL